MSVDMNENMRTFTATFTMGEPIEFIEPSNEVHLIAGRLNSADWIYYWVNVDEYDCEVGDYVIVQNKKDFDLVKVVGKIETTKELCKHITGTNIENMKRIVCVVDNEDLEDYR